MPDVTKYSNETDWMSACIPAKRGEGMEQDQAVAACMAMWREKKSVDVDADLQCYMSAEVKALGDGKLGGYLVRYGSPDETDLTGDYFAKDAYFGKVEELDVYYNHGLDRMLKRTVLSRAKLTTDEIGIWAEAQLNMADKYQQEIYKLAEAGKMGWSSGSAGHLVEREPVGKAMAIKRWPLVEASLTPTPAEWRNTVTPLKSLIPTGTPEAAVDNIPTQTIEEKTTMDETEIKAMVSDAAKAAAALAVEEYKASLPAVSGGYATEVKDEADRAAEGNAFKTGGEFLKAVIAAEQYGEVDKRLLPLKATGLNEAIPSQGGFLVPPQFASGIVERMYNVGNILSRVSMDSVTGNSMTYNALDETSRVDGSRWGGVQGYWLAEAATKTSSKPKFRQLDLKLKKVAALCYATDELLEDATALESWLNRTVPEELRFKTEDAFINGDGVGKPLGILNSPALVSFVRVDANEIDSTDIAKMWARRWAGARDYIWLINQDVFPQLINLTLGNYPVYMPPGGVSASPFGTIYGRPVIETEYNPSLGTLGDILLISPSQYQAISKGGVQAASSIHVQFVTDETAFRFVYRVDGAPIWNSALTPFKGSNTQSPFVALSASS